MSYDEHRRSVAPVRRRVEDPRLITGRGSYVDDITLPGMVHAVFVRSPEAHALVGAIEVTGAAAATGVIGAYVAADLGFGGPMPNMHPSPALADSRQGHPLATDEVCYVGEAVAVVVAEQRVLAVDAAEEVVVDYEPLPAVASLEGATADGAPPVHHGGSSNRVTRLDLSFGDIDGAFAAAEHVVGVTLRQHRGAGIPMEPRGVVAAADPETGRLTVWSSTQAPHGLRRFLSEYLGLSPEAVRVVAPDVGGGFGPKAAVYAEEYVVARLALLLGRPVKWVETRRENFTTMLQSRDQVHRLEAAVTGNGRLLGLRGTVIHDNGAYVPYGVLPAMTGMRLTPGPYVVPAIDVTFEIVYTNLVPTAAVRGAARPYAVFAMERVMDAIARRLDLDRAEVRRRNFIPRDWFPYEIPIEFPGGRRMVYDSGDYHQGLGLALTRADWDGFEDRRREAAARGRRRGIGVACYVEDTGVGPYEAARVRVGTDGEVLVEVGTPSQGQGHATVYTRIVSEHLGVDPSSVRVELGDTDRQATGASTVASRTAVTAGPSIDAAAAETARLARRLAAEHLEAAEADLVLEGGMVRVVGAPGAEISLAELAAAAGEGDGGLGLGAESAVDYQGPAFAYGTHVAEVEVDPDTGLVEVVAYTVHHDCGKVLDQMIVDGQIDGGVAHGLGNALLERLVHTGDGQPLTTTFMDYRITTAVEMPPLTKVHTQIPSPTNSLGVKGAGEGGTLPVAAAVASAVEDALADLGVVVDRHPLGPAVVRELVRGAGGAGRGVH